jgi:hypothetical protein
MLVGREVDIGFPLKGNFGPVAGVVTAYALHILLTVITIVGTFIGYRIIKASGARADFVIPPRDYRLLAPLVRDGKAESIDQYVRLSSLSGFTGTWTKLGLTGLPLATIALTLIFSLLAIVSNQSFMDLAKLTLGAFIGSFVQRQVEQRRDASGSTKSDQSSPTA